MPILPGTELKLPDKAWTNQTIEVEATDFFGSTVMKEVYTPNIDYDWTGKGLKFYYYDEEEEIEYRIPVICSPYYKPFPEVPNIISRQVQGNGGPFLAWPDIADVILTLELTTNSSFDVNLLESGSDFNGLVGRGFITPLIPTTGVFHYTGISTLGYDFYRDSVTPTDWIAGKFLEIRFIVYSYGNGPYTDVSSGSPVATADADTEAVMANQWKSQCTEYKNIWFIFKSEDAPPGSDDYSEEILGNLEQAALKCDAIEIVNMGLIENVSPEDLQTLIESKFYEFYPEYL